MTARRAEDLHGTGADAHERELVLAFKAGNAEAYVEIYDLYLPRARSICRRMLGDDHDVQEACQEVFLRVFQSLPRFNGRYQLGAWIARIATNHCLDVLRARSRRPGDSASFEELEDAPDPIVETTNPEVVYIRKAEGRRVRKVLKSLPPLHRAAIVLRDFEGLSYAEISDILGITECQLKALLHRARKGFKRSWPIEAAQLLIPGRFLERFRKGDVEAPAHAPHAPHVPPTPATSQVAEVVSSATPFVSSCAGALQQCGAAVTERVAAMVTVAVVGTASVGAAVLPSIASAERNPAPARIEVVTSTGAREPAGRAATSGRAGPGASTKATKTSGKEASETSETPAGSPTPSPTPSATPSPTPTSSEGGTASPKPTPTPPPPEPMGYGLDARVDLASNREPCDCMRSASTISEDIVVRETALQGFRQTTEGAAAAAGTPSYGVRLEHTSGSGSDHGGTLSLRSRGGSYVYSLSGQLVRRSTTEWGGLVYRYSGKYANTSRPSYSETMPERGTYVVEVTVSWRQQRITHVVIELTETQ